MSNDTERAAEEWITKNWYYGEAQGPDRRDQVLAFIAGAKHAKPRWINTKDETPRNGEIVLIPYQTYSLPAQYNISSSGEPFWLVWDCPGSIRAERTLHFVPQWMRLPSASEGQGK